MSGADAVAEPRSAEQALAYHARTVHRRTRYAAGPETIDWSSPPDPFRRFAGAPRTTLCLGAAKLPGGYDELLAGRLPAQPITAETVGLLLELSMAIAAWKQAGPDRWAVRVTPSSGNLHPTETYVVARGIPGLDDGVHHYAVLDHGLEHRFVPSERRGPKGLWIGLSSIHWREAWKYGERAFRYCQLDTGHAIGALRMAAGLLGWKLRLAPLRSEALESLLGLDRAPDFAGVEPEDGEVLLAITPSRTAEIPLPDLGEGVWQGKANMLDPHPMYHWPVIEEAAQATRQEMASTRQNAGQDERFFPPGLPAVSHPAAPIILGRRSAQQFDPSFTLGAAEFYRLLDCLLIRDCAPWDVWDFSPRLHPLIFVHRVSGLEPGVYFLSRRSGLVAALQAASAPGLLWERVTQAPAHLPLFRLARGDHRKIARILSCLQAIASDSAFSLGMIAEFSALVTANPWRYRQLHWEAGLIGQMLYLEAESLGLAGTGIGCFYDEDVHQALGLTDTAFQSLYHFTLGMRIADTRISSEAAYPDRS